MNKSMTVYVHKIVRIGKTSTGSQRYRFYSNMGSINMAGDARYGFELDKVNNLDNAPLVNEWAELTMRGTTFTDAKRV